MTVRVATEVTRHAGRNSDVVIGIDAGGSSTRARAVLRGSVVHEGTGGPGNPVMADPETLRVSYHAALAGCPAPSRVAACVSGTSRAERRAEIEQLLADRFPDAQVRVLPDYTACVMAAPRGTDVCIVAGTGSVVCSQAADGSFRVTGGHGWILGDHGSAARLGRAALEHFVVDPDRAPASFRDVIFQMFGSSDWRAVVNAVHAAANPAPLLARAAPLLTAAAEGQLPWAVSLLDEEMTTLAKAAVRHIEQYTPGARQVRVALSGGVWASKAARASITQALARATDDTISVARSMRDPLDGAVLLAAEG
ncbi:MAG: N-acetylglucosamine kinase [Streptosporangiaceae bacterium]